MTAPNAPRVARVEVERRSWARRADGAPTVGTVADVLPRLLVSWLRWRVVDGPDGPIVVACPARAAGSLRRLTGILLAEWFQHDLPLPGPRPDAAEWARIAEQFTAARLAEHAARLAALPEGDRLVAEHDARVAAERHRAELAQRAADGEAARAELAALDVDAPAPAVPAVEPQRRGRFGRNPS